VDIKKASLEILGIDITNIKNKESLEKEYELCNNIIRDTNKSRQNNIFLFISMALTLILGLVKYAYLLNNFNILVGIVVIIYCCYFGWRWWYKKKLKNVKSYLLSQISNS